MTGQTAITQIALIGDITNSERTVKFAARLAEVRLGQVRLG